MEKKIAAKGEKWKKEMTDVVFDALERGLSLVTLASSSNDIRGMRGIGDDTDDCR